jgi:hypothetical protein
MLDQGGDVVGHRLGAQRAVDVRGAAVALQVDGDDAPAGGQRGHDRLEHRAGAEAAVQQHERLAGAVLLVVQGQAVDVGVAHVVSSPFPRLRSQ